MGLITLASENRATGKVKKIFEQIKKNLGIDFVPNIYRAMAPMPLYLEAQWNKVQAVMQQPGKLDELTKEIIAITVSAQNNCHY